ncbi:unnamed protein product [Tilletia controversa]|uniref:Uncharacterized protein n=1 Tax=Tilletia controversa TaxID=13291 RepID=A0A8X7SWK9_9BASI|nr:hypothetical protein CF328_g4290 [Tilletia controversa]KAE8246290.1 hypothetical protein A4X06_0g5075 [Tilletia controversa]CAD6898868.1 unnamed protein product [Tilletia controversa]CAD6940274.1 unnamed protein product [Tilletia controversa]CAD6971287.1 unnamed protein product [Tilletia controversa]
MPTKTTSPPPIISKRTVNNHPYQVQIPARASSATHLPSIAHLHQDSDELEEELEQQAGLLLSNNRRRVSFDLNAILLPRHPHSHHGHRQDEHEDDDDDSDDSDSKGADEVPPPRTSSLPQRQLLASQSSPDLLTFASPRARLNSTPSPRRPFFGIASSSNNNNNKPRIMAPNFLRAPLPAKAKIARKNAIAQKHAAALELMLCGSSAPNQLVTAVETTSSTPTHDHSHQMTEPPAPKQPTKPKHARRWSLFPRLSAHKTESEGTESKNGSASDVSDIHASPQLRSVSPTHSDTASTDAHLNRTPTPTTPHLKLKDRLPLFRRVVSSPQKPAASTAQETPPQLTPKQIRTLKAALMDVDLANGIIGELRARSIDPLHALLTSSQISDVASTTETSPMQTEGVTTQVKPRCVLGPLLPPIEFALASLPEHHGAGAIIAKHERGTSAGGSRDDSALPDHVQPLDQADAEGPGAGAEGGEEDGSSASGPGPMRSAARRSLAQILSKVRPKTASSVPEKSLEEKSAQLQEKEPEKEKVDTKKHLEAEVAVVLGAAATAAAVVSLAAAAPSKTATARTSTIQEEEEEEEEAEVAVAGLSIGGGIENLLSIQPPKVWGMSPISLVMSPEQTIVSQMVASSGTFDVLADLSSAAALSPTAATYAEGDIPAGLGFPTDRLSFLLHWWGYEVLLPPIAISHLSTAQSISSAFLSFLSTMAISASLPEMLPFIKYISMWVELEFRAVREQDARGGGRGVVLAATWVMPMALVPRAWDYPVAPPALSPSPLPAPADQQPAPASSNSISPSGSASKELRNRMDGPPVPLKDMLRFQSGPALPALPVGL